jgi:xanthine dehydrogenase/oxidase
VVLIVAGFDSSQARYYVAHGSAGFCEKQQEMFDDLSPLVSLYQLWGRLVWRREGDQLCKAGGNVTALTHFETLRATPSVTAYFDVLTFWLNGRKVVIDNPDPTVMLTDYLQSINLTGTKVGCGQGGCGACTVMLSHREPARGDIVHRAVNACLRPLCSLDGMCVTTTEGIGSVHEGLDPVQFCIAAHNGTQCGFCTPGFVMNAHAFFQENPGATQKEIEDIFGGNLCRCTGYRPILHAVRTLASDYDAASDRTQKCEIDPSFPIRCRQALTQLELENLLRPGEPPKALHFTGSGREWYRPTTLAEVYRLKCQSVRREGRDQVKLVFGNTASGVYQHEKPEYLIDISLIEELGQLSEDDTGLQIGACVPIQRLMDFAAEVIARRSAEETNGLRALARHAAFIAGYQVRCAGSVAGNIFMAKDHAHRGEPFPSDLLTVMGALGATVSIGSQEYDDGIREYALMRMPDVDALPEDAVILFFRLPFTRSREYVQTYRVARRLQMSHPIVNAGFRCQLNESGRPVSGQVSIVYGGLDRIAWRAKETERLLAGRPWNQETLQSALAVLKQEIAEITASCVPVDDEGISTTYRCQLAENFFYKFFLHVALAIDPSQVSPVSVSAANHYDRPLSHGTQEFAEYPELYPLTKPIIKRAAFVQATGEVKYTQDIPLPTGGVHAAVVKSSKAHARFSLTKLASTREALEELLRRRFRGFEAIITAADIPDGGSNLVGLGDDDPVFCDGIVTSVGAPIALAVADTIATAREAAAFIEAECIGYDELPAVLTLDEAIAQNTAMPMVRRQKDADADVEQQIPSIVRPGSDLAWLGDPARGLPGTSQVSGAVCTGAQAHFYLETFCALAIPGMYDQMTVYNSTQNPNGNQSAVAKTLGIKANQVTLIVEQIGGGFGAKQHRASVIASQAAVAARKLKRPVRLLYDRATDTTMVGKRHPYRGEYRVAYTPDGTIEAMRMDMHSDAGDTYDCSFAVMDLSVLQSDGCYMVKTFQSTGRIYRTNKPSNTAFRTFGNLQPYIIREDAIEHVAHQLSKDLGRRVLPEEIRRKNLYRTGSLWDYDLSHHGQRLRFCNIRDIWDSLYQSSDFERREREVQNFNRQNRWRKRGIAMMPQKYGIAFTEPRGSLNASSALVNVNMADGSVFVQHGGVEMGQGLHTKIAQVAANTLGIPLEWIRVAGNNSDAIVNAPATAASTGYDLNAGAVDRACRVLRTRLENFCRELEQYTPFDCIEGWRSGWQDKWKEIIFGAWFNRVNLSAAELYKTPHYKGPSERHRSGHPYLYYVYSAAVTEVEIDVLTGEFTILRADVLYDAAKSPNPAIDIGQLEGGYVQGVGFVTTEEVVYDHHGRLVTDNIWSYKPPCTKTIPLDFRVKLFPVDEARNALEETAELHAVKSSKTTGEPGMTLGATAFLAIKRAIMDARRDLTGSDDWLAMNVPATCQRIQTLCGVSTESFTL